MGFTDSIEKYSNASYGYLNISFLPFKYKEIFLRYRNAVADLGASLAHVPPLWDPNSFLLTYKISVRRSHRYLEAPVLALGLGRIFGSSNICSAMHECQISDTNFYPRTFGTFPNSSGDIMIYGQSDILSNNISSCT